MRRIARPRVQHRLAEGVAWLLVTFLVLFPKGGLKLGGVPLTWGYLVMAATAPPLLVWRLLVLPLRMQPMLAAVLASCLPFQLVFLYSIVTNGYESVAYLLSLLVCFFALPYIFLFLYPPFFPMLDRARFVRLFCGCIFWAAAFGIFLFFWKPLTGKLIEIPLLTVNLADYGQIELTKHIARGAFLKLISTYNNGNVYGVATLLLLPLYSTLEPRRYRRVLVRVALVLTLSRTIWAGLVAEQLLAFGRPLLASLPTFPRVYLAGSGKRLLLLGTTTVGILTALFAGSYSLAFLFDPSLGGRIGEFSSATQATLLPSVVAKAFSEVLFASALTYYGYTGFFGVALLFTFPVVLCAVRPELLRDPVRRGAAKGLVLYLIVSTSDGATDLIPVMAFYWFVYAVMVCGLPGTLGADLPGRAAAEGGAVLHPSGDARWSGSPARA